MNDAFEHLGWLIRDPSGGIRGPFARTEILQLLKKNQLRNKVEISRANSYWFTPEEKIEVARFFPELGGPAVDEGPTQMTATLTQANVEPAIEQTQVISVPEGGEWLNPEDAAEFGADIEDFDLATSTNMIKPAPAAADPDATQKFAPGEGEEIAVRHEAERRRREEVLNRAQVKADTLPSEYHDYQGERPKPVDALFRAPERGSAVAPNTIVSVPVEPSSPAKVLRPPERKKLRLQALPRNALLAAAGVATLGLLGAILFTKDPAPPARPRAQIEAGNLVPFLKRSLLLLDLDGAKRSLSELELSAGGKGEALLPLAQGIMRKEFLFDAEGAIGALQTARSLSADPKQKAEVENLLAIYRFERDPAGAAEDLKRVAEANPEQAVFRYNWALALQRQDRPVEAVNALAPLFNTLGKNDPLLEDASLLLGWARETASRGEDSAAGNAFSRALELNPDHAKARIGLAIFRLNKGGLRESEGDFKAFVESMPELDPPARVPNFRQMSDGDFYRYARTRLAELNMPGSAVGNKPSPMIMAADALISSIQSQNADALKIVSDAVKNAPGEPHALRAMGYVLWKDGKYDEVTELLKESPRTSFAVNLLLAKAYLKQGRRAQAEQPIASLTVANPLRSDGFAMLGEWNLNGGKGEEARRYFGQALKLNPYDLLARRGLARLKAPDVVSPEIARNLPF